MRLKLLAADTRDPVATVAFSLLGIAGALGWIPRDIDPNLVAEVTGMLMGLLAGVFSLWHHRDFKGALHEGLEARERATGPEKVAPDETTPIEGIPTDGR